MEGKPRYLLRIGIVFVSLTIVFLIAIQKEPADGLAYADTAVTPSRVLPLRNMPLITPSPTLRTVFPTMNPTQEHWMGEVIPDKKCKLPCYFGITPGITSMDEANSILKSVSNFPSMQADGNQYWFPLFFGHPDVSKNREIEIYQSLYLTVRSGKVQKMYTSVEAFQSSQEVKGKFNKIWSRYSLREIIKQFGVPDEIYFAISQYVKGYSLIVAFEKPGVVVDYGKWRKGDSICPLSRIDDNLTLDMTVTNTNLLSNIYAEWLVPPTNTDVYSPIQDALGISSAEFIQQLQKDPAQCFIIRKYIH